jgi:hypothetical protein
MAQVKFTKFGANSAFGGFAPGDKLRCSDAMAKHLVDEGVAVYVQAPAPAAVEPPATAPAAPMKTGKRGK